MENTTVILGITGVLVFVVQVVVEVIKRLPVINRVPTNIVVLVLSIGATVGCLCGYKTYIEGTSLWYEYVLAVAGGFIVAYIAMFGWGKLKELWERCKMRKHGNIS